MPKDLEGRSEGTRNEITITADGRLVTVGCGGRNGTKAPELPGLRTECSERYRGTVRGISNDGTWVMSSTGTKAYLQHQSNGKLLVFDQERDVDFMELSDDSTLLLTGSLQDDVSHLWRTADGTELCRIVLMQTGAWIVVDKDGRFDTDDIEATRGLNWIMPDDPLRPIPLDIFMRDYYSPGLLTRKLDGDVPAVPDIAKRDLDTPRVTFENFYLNKEKTALNKNLGNYAYYAAF